MTQVGFDLPTLPIQLGESRRRVTLRIQQGGYQRDLPRAPSALGDGVTQFTHHHRARQLGKRFCAEPDRPLLRLEVFDELVMPTQTLAPARSRQTALATLARLLGGAFAVG